MRLLATAGFAFVVAATALGHGPFGAGLTPRWQAVADQLAAAKPQARLAHQVRVLFQPDTTFAR